MGGTGLVGGHLVRLLAEDPDVDQVVAPVRRPVTRWLDRDGVEAPVVDFDALAAHADRLVCRQLFICLGTTMRKAGSKEAFRRVDLDYVVESARIAAEGGARDAFLVSSVGAAPGSAVFYSRIKGEAEQALRALPFRSTHILRPSVLVGARPEARPGELLGVALGRLLTPLLRGPARRYRPIDGLTVARAMARLAARPEEGVHVLESEEIQALGM
jgi:uncharacterized protein YbjT (DUF2867 family)